MKKQIIFFASCIIGSGIILYLAGCVMAASFSIADWPELIRSFMAIVWIASVIATAFATSQIK